MRDFVRRERERRERSMTLDELRKLIADAQASGMGSRSFAEIIAEGDRIARAGSFMRD